MAMKDIQRGRFPGGFRGRLAGGQGEVLYDVQQPFQKALLTGKTTHAAWRDKPSFYAVLTVCPEISVRYLGDLLPFVLCCPS
jgi:hypothetical protein